MAKKPDPIWDQLEQKFNAIATRSLDALVQTVPDSLPGAVALVSTIRRFLDEGNLLDDPRWYDLIVSLETGLTRLDARAETLEAALREIYHLPPHLGPVPGAILNIASSALEGKP